jgi:hypothetical protein
MGRWTRLNFFQRMMLRWRELHPYNAVHAVRVPVSLEPECLRACIAERLELLGLTGLAVDQRRWRFRYEGGPAAVDLTVAFAASDPHAELSRTIEREINRPFPPAQRENPFRFFAIDEGDAFQLVLVYDHYVASGDSLARLLTGIACSIAKSEATRPTKSMGLHSDTYRSVVLRHPLGVIRAILGLPRMVAKARRAYRPRYASVVDTYNAYKYVRIGPPQLNALLSTAKAYGVSLNELMMACLLLALSPLAAERRGGRRRNELAIASILNMRRDFRPEAREAMSPFLAAIRVSHTVPDGIGLRQLAQDVHVEVARLRQGRVYLQSLMALGVSAMLWPWLSDAKRGGLYAKHFPVWAGITSLNVNAIWVGANCTCASRFDYVRAAPTGPLCPMVFAVTTANDLLHVGITFRTTAFTRAAVDRLAAALLLSIDQLREDSSA